MQNEDGQHADEDEEGSLLEWLLPWAQRWRTLVFGPLLAGVLAFAGSYLIAPTYTAKVAFLPPQQQQSGAAAALSSLGALGGLAAGVANIRTPTDQYAALLQSNVITDRLIDAFKLMAVYEVDLRVDARKRLASNVRINIGKKDGLISIEVDDTSKQRATDMANQHVAELRKLTSELALTEAQQRRQFFEGHLKTTRASLIAAQRTLEGSAFTAGNLRAEPKSAAEGYARLQAEVTASEVKLQGLRQGLTDAAPEVQQLLGVLGALKSRLNAYERTDANGQGADYIGKYRDFKYQETLFELFSRQYELARLDESREGATIQMIDPAQLPERKTRPNRVVLAASTALIVFIVLVLAILIGRSWRAAQAEPETAERLARLRVALRGR